MGTASDFSIIIKGLEKPYRIPALLVDEDFKCSSMHYFRHKQAPE
jgi:hypothetical protein